MENSYLILKRIIHLLDIPFTNDYLKDIFRFPSGA